MAGRDQTLAKIKLLRCRFEDMMADTLETPRTASIFRTPQILSRQNERAYTPTAFSFGPYHYDESRPAQRIKWKNMQGLLRRSRSPELKWRELIGAITSLKDAARECYAGSINLDDQEFIEVLVLDGCFIIEIFRLYHLFCQRGSDQSISAFKEFLYAFKEFLYHDLVLLENQIPWVVLEHLFSLTMDSQQESLITLSLNFFSLLFSTSVFYPPNLFQGQNIMHILDLLWHSLVNPLGKKQRTLQMFWQPCRCASGMKKAGIKIVRHNPDSILDIQFEDGVLQIPQLEFNKSTEAIFRNLICFEQCYPGHQPIVTSYVKFMNILIDTTKDLEILYESGVIIGRSTPEVPVQFFNKLCDGCEVNDFFYDNICHDIIYYCRGWWPRLRFLYLDNFLSPWAKVSQVVGAILLILTFLQTLFSILSYK